jgi:hypothetical protein
MSDVDSALRSLLAERAADVPQVDGLLAAVHARSRRARRRRLAATGLFAAVVVLLGVTLTQVVGKEDNRLVTVSPPAPLVRNGPPPSPVDFGWLPRGFGAPEAYLLGHYAWAVEAQREKPYVRIAVQVMSTEPKTRNGAGKLTTVDLNGIRGSLYTVPKHDAGAPPYGNTPPEAEGPYAELIFQRKPGQWVRIIAQNASGDVDMGITGKDMRKIALELQDRRRPLRDLVRFATLPPGLDYGTVTSSGSVGAAVEFVDAGAPAQPVLGDALSHSSAGGVVSVWIGNADGMMVNSGLLPPGKGAKVKVGTHQGVLGKDPRAGGATVLAVTLPAAQTIVVTAAPSSGISDRDLIRFAAGITLGKDYKAGTSFRRAPRPR